MENKDLNKVELIGTLPRDAIVKKIGANNISVANFTVTTTKKWMDPSTSTPKSSSQYIVVSAWRTLAETNGHLLIMGTRVRVVGEITSRSWDNPQTGKKEYKTEVVASTIEILPETGTIPRDPKNETINPDDLPF